MIEFRTDCIFHIVTYPKLHFPTKIQPNRIEIAKVFYFGVISGWLGWVKHGPDTLCVPF